MERVQAERGVLASGQGAVADPLGRIRADQADLGCSFRSEEIKEPLEGGPVVAGGGPHQPAGVVVDNDHQVLVAAPVGDLIDPDPGQPIERVPHRPGIRDNPTSDRPHSAPRDPHLQLDHRRLGDVGDQPGHPIIEDTAMTGAVTRPGHRSNCHTMVSTRHPRCVGFDEHLGRPGIQCPPAAPTLAVVVAT